jgi:hypothetical protein
MLRTIAHMDVSFNARKNFFCRRYFWVFVGTTFLASRVQKIQGAYRDKESQKISSRPLGSLRAIGPPPRPSRCPFLGRCHRQRPPSEARTMPPAAACLSLRRGREGRGPAGPWGRCSLGDSALARLSGGGAVALHGGTCGKAP